MGKSDKGVIIHFALFLILASVITGCAKKPEKRDNKQKNAVEAEPGWQLLFDGNSLEKWEITEFGTQGPVQVSGGSISLGMGDGCTGITWTGHFPKINYEVQLEAKKVSGNDFFCGITFPFDSTFCSFIVGGWGGPVVGLSTIDGQDASGNETRILKKFDHNKWYKINLKVTDRKIEAWIDDEKIVDFNPAGHKLYIRPEVELSKPFGICSWITTAEIRNIQLRELKE